MKKLYLLIILICCTNQSYAQCQEIEVILDDVSVLGTTETDPNTGEEITYYDVCQGEEITFSVSGNYPQNNTTYEQSDVSSTFSWLNNGMNPQSGQVATYTFPNGGGNEITIQITDVEGCSNTEVLTLYVRVSTTPSINVIAEPNIICPNQNTLVTAIANTSVSTSITTVTPWETACEDEFSDPLYLPDGNGAEYETDIEISCFSAGQTLINAADILSVDINIEHSYTGDLDIYLTAPNGQQITLFEQAGGGTWFGEATDQDASATNPGVGYDYGWSMNPSYQGTMAQGMGNNTTGNSLNEDTYFPIEDFNSLIGTELNGTWTLTVVDNLTIDNGWIFSWGLSINPDIIPSEWGFTPTIVETNWVGDPATTVNVDGDQMTVNVPSEGSYTYDFEVIDNFGCSYLESATINALDAVTTLSSESTPDNCTEGIGTATVEGENGTLPYSYFWPSLGLLTPNISGLQAGTYPYIITDALGCTTEGVVTVDQEGPTINLEVLESTDDACSDSIGTILVQPLNGIPPFVYNWNNSSSTDALGTNLPEGSQTVTVTDGNGCIGTLTESIGNIPPPEVLFSYSIDLCSKSLVLINESQDINQSQWFLNNEVYSQNTNPIFEINDGGDYEITLIGSHEYCSNSLTQTINLDDLYDYNYIDIPNIFSPNGDDINDEFKVLGLLECDYSNLTIYNRWGEEIFFSLYPKTEFWDGKRLGNEADEGIYFYTLEMKYKTFKGSLTLIR